MQKLKFSFRFGKLQHEIFIADFYKLCIQVFADYKAYGLYMLNKTQIKRVPNTSTRTPFHVRTPKAFSSNLAILTDTVFLVFDI